MTGSIISQRRLFSSTYANSPGNTAYIVTKNAYSRFIFIGTDSIISTQISRLRIFANLQKALENSRRQAVPKLCSKNEWTARCVSRWRQTLRNWRL